MVEETIEKKADVTEVKKKDSNVVFVGSKEIHSYVLACLAQSRDCGEIHIKARGKQISKAVDISQVFINKFSKGAKVKNVEVGTDQKVGEDGQPFGVSFIDLTLSVSG